MVALSDRDLLRAQALRCLEDPFYLSTDILKLKDDAPRSSEELRPIYDWYTQPRPHRFTERRKWLRYWSSPRFTAKTYIFLVYVFWRILLEPDLRVIIQSEEKQMAVDSVKLLRAWFMLPKVIQLFGEFEKKGEWGSEEFTIAQRTKTLKDPTLRALGLDVPMQGKRCDLMGFDDLIGESNNNEDGILKVETRISASLPILRPGGEAIYLCTRWSPYDPSTDGYTMSGAPGILKQWRQNETWDAPPPRGYFGAYAKDGDHMVFPNAVKGEPLFPGILPEETIKEYRETMHRREYNSQILNDPLPEDTRYFSHTDLQYFEPFDEEGNRHEVLVGAVPFVAMDPASGKTRSKSKNKLDDTAIAGGYVKWEGDIALGYLTHWDGGIWKTDKMQDKLLELMRVLKPQKIFIEVNIGGEHIIAPLRARAAALGFPYLPIDDFHESQQKPVRIGALQEHYAYRRIWHANKLKSCKGEDQLLRWTPTGGGQDDWADVAAMLFLRGMRRKVRAAGAQGPTKFNIMGRKPRYRYTGT